MRQLGEIAILGALIGALGITGACRRSDKTADVAQDSILVRDADSAHPAPPAAPITQMKPPTGPPVYDPNLPAPKMPPPRKINPPVILPPRSPSPPPPSPAR